MKLLARDDAHPPLFDAYAADAAPRSPTADEARDADRRCARSSWCCSRRPACCPSSAPTPTQPRRCAPTTLLCSPTRRRRRRAETTADVAGADARWRSSRRCATTTWRAAAVPARRGSIASSRCCARSFTIISAPHAAHAPGHDRRASAGRASEPVDSSMNPSWSATGRRRDTRTRAVGQRQQGRAAAQLRAAGIPSVVRAARDRPARRARTASPCTRGPTSATSARPTCTSWPRC